MKKKGRSTAGSRTYHGAVERQGEAHAEASSHGHTLTLGGRRGDPTAGLNAAETLLASLGACLITNVNALADKMRLQVNGLRVEIEGDRRYEPPGLVQIRYHLLLTARRRRTSWRNCTHWLSNGVR
jgi:uncharacterized OsmC-like protein